MVSGRRMSCTAVLPFRIGRDEAGDLGSEGEASSLTIPRIVTQYFTRRFLNFSPEQRCERYRRPRHAITARMILEWEVPGC